MFAGDFIDDRRPLKVCVKALVYLRICEKMLIICF